jgi:hypothetical protein
VEFFAERIEPVDVGLGGLRIYSDAEYVTGTILRLDIFSAGASPATFTAQVMWVKAGGPGAPASYDVGLAFVDLSAQAHDIILPLLESDGDPDDFDGDPIDEARAPADSSVELIADGPISEIRATVLEPATLRQGEILRGMLAKVPVVVASPEKLRAEQLDARAGFVLSMIDGVTTVESLLDVSGMSADETLAILEDLNLRAIVDFRPGPGGLSF